MHAGGRAQQDLVAHISNISNAAIQLWRKLGNQAPNSVVQNGEVQLFAEHIFSALAVIKRMGREINSALTSAIHRQSWAKICVHDYQQVTTKIRNSRSWRRSLIGYANFFYGPLKLSSGDLETAARSLGLWTPVQWE